MLYKIEPINKEEWGADVLLSGNVSPHSPNSYHSDYAEIMDHLLHFFCSVCRL